MVTEPGMGKKADRGSDEGPAILEHSPSTGPEEKLIWVEKRCRGEIQDVAREGVLVLTDATEKEVKFTMEDGYKIIQN